MDFSYENIIGASDTGGLPPLLMRSVTSNDNDSMAISQNITMAAYKLFYLFIASYTDTGGSAILCPGIPVAHKIPGLDTLQLFQVPLATLSIWISNSTVFVPFVNGMWQFLCQPILRSDSNDSLDNILTWSGRDASSAANVSLSVRGYNFMPAKTRTGTMCLSRTLERYAISYLLGHSLAFIKANNATVSIFEVGTRGTAQSQMLGIRMNCMAPPTLRAYTDRRRQQPLTLLALG